MAVTRLDEALAEYAKHLERRPISDNTRKAFWGDVSLFARFIMPPAGPPSSSDAPVSGKTQANGNGQHALAAPLLSTITTERIRQFIAHEEKRTNANSPKSIERRLTSVKVFFRWLHEAGHIAHDPADSVPYKPLVDPIPEYLTEPQAEAVLRAARDVAAGDKLDTRPFAIISLVLETGMKKGECLAVTSDDVERSPNGVWIRYDKKHLKFKERRLPISDDALAALDAHIERYQPKGRLFDCTGRNLEYIFNRKVAPPAGLPFLTFEQLRWTSALRDFRSGAYNEEQLQFKYGLSPLGWSEMEAKLQRIVKGESNESGDDESQRPQTAQSSVA